ncbi:MAG TPA: (deoxy)nucleoside triphosphate pyrophosphohydrolase [Patescibacteria group bacterium]|nr:(deoxy)nucleoside triphosphate pyrophosphohydrolase [Patescibacteria group bacterium]
MMQNEIHVAIALIFKGDEILLCQRLPEARYGLKWEFPGGKLELDETPEMALKRELFEELAIDAEIGELMLEKRSEFSDGGVFCVSVFKVESFKNDIQNRVFHDVKWISPDKLLDFDLLEGNVEICRKIQEQLAFKN